MWRVFINISATTLSVNSLALSCLSFSWLMTLQFVTQDIKMKHEPTELEFTYLLNFFAA